jgi:hypothetical protein
VNKRSSWWVGVIGLVGLTVVAGCGKPGGSSDTPAAGGGGTTSSATTAQIIERKIKADPDLAKADIKVKQEAGSISLEGTVANQDMKDKAEKIVTDAQKEMKQQPGVLDNLLIQEGGAKPAGGSGK